MKRVHTVCMCVILLLHGYLHAQESPLPVNQSKTDKPLLFASLPEEFECNADELEKLMFSQVDEQVNEQLSSQFQVKGKIVDKHQQNGASFSINVRLENYNNALFNLSARLLADNSLAIQGRVLHPRYGDVLVLTKESGKYFFRKKLQRLVMPE